MARLCSLFGAALFVGCAPGAVDEESEAADEMEDEISGARVDVAPGPTQDPELVKTLPVGKSESSAERRVVMRLSPSDIPNLQSGDRLIALAEAQVTTRCDIGQNAPGCGYNPNVAAALVLTGNKNDTSANGAGSALLSSVEKQTCTKAEHHCMFVFRAANASQVLQGALDLPCVKSQSCSINLVMWAWHHDARSGGVDKVIVGGNDGNYLDNEDVDPDQGRLSLVRERNISGQDRDERDSSGSANVSVNTNANPVLIYSHRLKPKGEKLKAGEQFVIDAKVVAEVSSRARFSTQLFLSHSPNATDGQKLNQISPDSISEHNGVNCLPGSPCVTRKVAVFRVDADIDDAIYVNLVAKSAVPGGGSTNVVVKRDQGSVHSTRYRAALGD